MEARYQPGVRTSTFLQPGMLGECLLIVVNWGRSFQQEQIPNSCKQGKGAVQTWGQREFCQPDAEGQPCTNQGRCCGKPLALLGKSWNEIQPISARISQFLGWFSHPSTAFSPLCRDTDAKNVMQDVKKFIFCGPAFSPANFHEHRLL